MGLLSWEAVFPFREITFQKEQQSYQDKWFNELENIDTFQGGGGGGGGGGNSVDIVFDSSEKNLL